MSKMDLDLERTKQSINEAIIKSTGMSNRNQHLQKFAKTYIYAFTAALLSLTNWKQN